MGTLHIIDHPLIQSKLTRMRDARTDNETFRRLLDELTALMVYEITRDYPLREIELTTPLEQTTGRVLDARVVLVPILRAGTGMLGGVDDFELVRQVYGDSTNNAAGNNGPVTQRVALVRRPGDGVPPMFSVYMKGSTTPWDWSNGPVPAAQLGDIERVAVQITAPSGKRDWRGRYAESHYSTEVNSLRNTPQTSADEYVVDGYVFNDSIVVNRIRDPGEVGLAGATLRLGVITTTSTSSGYFSFRVPAGTYQLKQIVPPAGYVNTSVPESLSVTVPPAVSRSFPDAALPGGRIAVFVYEDLDNDGVFDAGETGMAERPGHGAARRRLGLHGRLGQPRLPALRAGGGLLAQRDAARFLRRDHDESRRADHRGPRQPLPVRSGSTSR